MFLSLIVVESSYVVGSSVWSMTDTLDKGEGCWEGGREERGTVWGRPVVAVPCGGLGRLLAPAAAA